MKKYFLFLVFAIMAIIAISCNSNSTNTKTESTDIQKKVVYTCPMHSEVESDKEGDCPKCGMALIVKQ